MIVRRKKTPARTSSSFPCSFPPRLRKRLTGRRMIITTNLGLIGKLLAAVRQQWSCRADPRLENIMFSRITLPKLVLTRLLHTVALTRTKTRKAMETGPSAHELRHQCNCARQFVVWGSMARERRIYEHESE